MLEAFGITDPAEQREWNDKLVKRVRSLEHRLIERRAQEGKHIIGKARLLNQPLTLEYQSLCSGKRSARQEFIRYFKSLLSQAREVYQRWHLGDFSVSYHLGLFPPAQPRLAELWLAA